MTPFRDATLEQTLHRVSTACLGGDDVPRILRAWWSIALRTADVPGIGDLLRPVDHGGLIEAHSLLDGPVTATQLAMARDALDELALIAEGVCDGLLVVGYWRRGNTPLDRCPVVGIDDEGQMVLLGRDLADALASRIGWEPDRAQRLDAFRAAFALEGVAQHEAPSAIFEAMRDHPELAAPFRALSLRWLGVGAV